MDQKQVQTQGRGDVLLELEEEVVVEVSIESFIEGSITEAVKGALWATVLIDAGEILDL